MKRIISFILCGLTVFTFIGCGGIHVSFDCDKKEAQEEVKQEQNDSSKSAADDKTDKGDAKQTQNAEDRPTVVINEAPKTQSKSDVVIIREQPQASEYSGSFVFSNSDCAYLTQSQVSSLSNYQLGIARNEIYARHGYIFSTERWITYFNAQRWYSPINKSVTLNKIEEYNVGLLKAEENRRGIQN